MKRKGQSTLADKEVVKGLLHDGMIGLTQGEANMKLKCPKSRGGCQAESGRRKAAAEAAAAGWYH